MELLPRELIQLVTSFTDARAKRNLRQTCTSFFNIINQSRFTLYFTRSSMMPAIVETFSRYNKPISLTFTKTINLTPRAINHLSSLTNLVDLYFDKQYRKKEVAEMSDLTRLTNLNSLQFRTYSNDEMLTSFSNLTSVYLNNANVEDGITILRANSKLEAATIRALDSFEHFNNISNIQYLNIDYAYYTANDVEALKQAHRLKKLVMQISSEHHVSIPLYALTSLISLRIEDNTRDSAYLTGLRHLNKLEVFTYSGNLGPNMTSDWTLLTNLKKLSLDVPVGNNDPKHTLEFLTGLSRLLECIVRHSDGPPYNLCEILPNSLTKLHLDIEASNCLESINQLTNLQQLSISDYEGVPITYDTLTDLTHLTEFCFYTNEARESLTSIAQLTNLKRLTIDSYQNNYRNIMFDLSKMTDLEDLTMPSITIEIFQSLSPLSKLTLLEARYDFYFDPVIFERMSLKRLSVQTYHDNNFWQSLVQVTSLESLSVSNVDSEDKIISFTAFKNLTELEVFSSNHLPYKRFTCLTSLQRLYFPTNLNSDEERSVELTEKMPYLYSAEL